MITVLVFTQKADLSPSRPLRDLCASARKNRDVASWKTIPLQSNNTISSRTARDIEKTDLSPFFTACVFIFSQRLRRERGEDQRGIGTFLRMITLFLSTRCGILKTDLSPLVYYPRLHFRAEARRFRRERGGDQRGVVTFFKEWQRYFSHTPHGMLKTDLSRLRNPSLEWGNNRISSHSVKRWNTGW